MKKSLIAVFAMAACCFAANPYTGLMTNLNIATFGVTKSNVSGAKDIPYAVEFAKAFRTSLQNHVSKKYPATTFSKVYSNSNSNEATASNFTTKVSDTKNKYNIVMFAGHGVSYGSEGNRSRHNALVMYDKILQVENITFTDQTYFAFMHACNFLSFYTDDYGREKYGFYYKYRNDTKPVTTPVTNYSEGDDDGWEDSKDAKPQNLAYSRFVNAFANGLHGMFGFSSTTVVPFYINSSNKPYATVPDIYETFAQKWVDDGLRIWQAYKYAVWKHIYKARSRGIEPAVIFKSGTAIGNDGKNHSFKGYCEFYKTIYQYPMKKGSLGRKKAVYGYPVY